MQPEPGFRMDPRWYWSKERAEQEWSHIWSRLWHVGPREEEMLNDATLTSLKSFRVDS